MERKGDKNLELLVFHTKFSSFAAETDRLVVYCEQEILCGEKIKNYDHCYLFSEKEYHFFLVEEPGKKHRVCFVYRDECQNRLYLHPCIVIVRIDKASLYSSYHLNDEQHLGQFLLGDRNGFREANLYNLIIDERVEEKEEECVEILDL